MCFTPKRIESLPSIFEADYIAAKISGLISRQPINLEGGNPPH
jgi:hypothetical protein